MAVTFLLTVLEAYGFMAALILPLIAVVSIQRS